MDDDNETFDGIDPEQVRAIERKLKAASPRYSSPMPLARIVRYLARDLSLAEREETARGLTDDSACRSLTEAHAALRRLQEMPWEEARARGGDGFEGQAAAIWIAIVEQTLAQAHRVKDWWQANGYEAARRESYEGAPIARIAWAAFLAFWDQTRVPGNEPAQFATTRLRKRGSLSIESTGALRVSGLGAEIDKSGNLLCRATVRFTQPGRVAGTQIPEAFLFLRHDGQQWLLEREPIQDDGPPLRGSEDETDGLQAVPAQLIEWHVLRLGYELALSNDLFPVGTLDIALTARGGDSPTPLRSWAGIDGAPRSDDRRGMIEVRLQGEPVVDDGSLRVLVALPLDRLLECEQMSLLVDVLIAIEVWQHFQSIPVRQFGARIPGHFRLPSLDSAGTAEIEDQLMSLPLDEQEAFSAFQEIVIPGWKGSGRLPASLLRFRLRA